MKESSERKFVFVPAFLFATPIKGAEPYGYQLNLPLSEIPMLADLPICEDVLAPISEYRCHGQNIPSICLVFPVDKRVGADNCVPYPYEDSQSIEASTDEERPPVSVMGQEIPGVGFFPALYGLQRYLDDDREYDKEDLKNLYLRLEAGESGVYFQCYSDATWNTSSMTSKRFVNELLHTEHFDFLVTGNKVGHDFVVWNRLRKSFGIWMDGHSIGYSDCAFDCVSPENDL
jgi:hypothetical protein